MPSPAASSPPASGRTQAGKARSSLNALRHGLTARVVVLPSEDMDVYQTFSKEIVASLDAQRPVERQFAQTVADNQWRINRIRSIEDGMLGMGHFEAAGDFDCPSSQIHAAMTAARAFRDDSKSFVNLSIYEQRLHRTMKEALRQLKELQTERRERKKTEMDDAIRLLKTQQMKGLPPRTGTGKVRLCERRNHRPICPPRPLPGLPGGRKSGLQPRPIHSMVRKGWRLT
jgi:hypothetical protein